MRGRDPHLGTRLPGLRQAVDALEGVPVEMLGDSPALERAREVLGNAGRRRELSAEHTVVALAGATGSGKSSVLNALAGADVAVVAARRPTTSHPLAVLWPGGGVEMAAARPLLEWLEVDRQHEVAPASDGWTVEETAGLVLLDLPDIDSIEIEHRRRAERLAKTVDVLVWVLDPQKYADAVVHTEFLRPMSRHAEITLVVLNQVDLLAEPDRPAVIADLKGRLAEDGLGGARVLPLSARTGEGVPELRRAIGGFVKRRRAADVRLAADVATAAGALDADYHADIPDDLPGAAQRQLVQALAAAAGVDRVADAVADRSGTAPAATPGGRCCDGSAGSVPDPLRRLHLDRAIATDDGPVLTTSSLPAASPVQRAQVATALRDLGESAAGGSGEPWRSYVRAGATEAADTLPDALDQAVVRTDLPGRRDPAWFAVVGALQWLVFALFVVGALWLGVYAVLGYLQIDAMWVPQIGPEPADPPLPALPAIPWPTALLVGGAVLGLLVALASSLAARLGARRRAARSRAALRRSIAQTAQQDVVAPVQARMTRARSFAAGIERAR